MFREIVLPSRWVVDRRQPRASRTGEQRQRIEDLHTNAALEQNLRDGAGQQRLWENHEHSQRSKEELDHVPSAGSRGAGTRAEESAS